MTESTNLQIIRSTYKGPDYLIKALSKEVEWTEAEGFPYGGTYVGVEAVIENVFSRLASEWDDFRASVHTYHEVNSKEIVIAEGIYSGVYKTTGKVFQADFVHVWELRNRKVVRFKQYVDSHTVQQALLPS
ncbi:nuclear transport factor 2 family protein [Bacillus sp. Xin]|uniref:nuclear transport factor 2 family protein n=1 Tax=unclassified Bacillus (in: firmicutes) TaxID=185979 RepID=UPI0015722E02|nr:MULTISPECIES: nuclear transport factor 2 family protein [unclassified Bacillus (in: firmicutes)]MBC6974812.1 nuclear transport factor 2 family protein [Bacillus sp. Xin]NSW37084.1 nuclear transport factor 2 family protein [Bacillus sp. Xin1]